MQVFFRCLASTPNLIVIELKDEKTLPFWEILRYNRCHLYDVQNV
jgi:hypothetical protein